MDFFALKAFQSGNETFSGSIKLPPIRLDLGASGLSTQNPPYRALEPLLLPPANEVWGKVIFLHLFVILFTGGCLVRGCLLWGSGPGGGATWWRPPPGQLLLQTVHILLECILVKSEIFTVHKRSLQGYVFTPVCQSFCSQGGWCLPQCMLGYTPREQTPPLEQTPLPCEQTPSPPGAETPPPPVQCILGDTGNKRAVRILLECILVCPYICAVLICTKLFKSKESIRASTSKFKETPN